MTPTPRVFFLVDSTRFQTEAAEKWGTRVFLFPALLRSPLSPNELIQDCMVRLEEEAFDSANDYIALTGPVIQLSVFFAAVMAKYGRYGSVNTLIFDARTSEYVSRLLDLNELGIGIGTSEYD